MEFEKIEVKFYALFVLPSSCSIPFSTLSLSPLSCTISRQLFVRKTSMIECNATKRNETKQNEEIIVHRAKLCYCRIRFVVICVQQSCIYREQTFSKSNNIAIFDKRNQYRNNGRRFMKCSRVRQFLFLNTESKAK